MTDQTMSPLRRRMIEDMTIRKFAPARCGAGAQVQGGAERGLRGAGLRVSELVALKVGDIDSILIFPI
jgi:hypothetical protein